MSGPRSNWSLAARRGRPYDKGRGFLAQALWVAMSTLIFTQVWCPNRLRCAILRLVRRSDRRGGADQASGDRALAVEASIGDNSSIGTGTELYNLDNIVIGSDVCISQHVYLCTGSHDRRSPTFEFDNGPIVIENGVWLCARSYRAARRHHRRELGRRRNLAGFPRRSTRLHRSAPSTDHRRDADASYCRS